MRFPAGGLVTQLLNIAMTPEQIHALQSAGDRLNGLLMASDKFVGETVKPPVLGSPIDMAYKADLRDAYDNAHQLMFSAESHLHGLLSIITNTGRPIPNFAPFTLLRAAADADVRARHLLAPGISETDRLARALNERLDNLDQQRKIDPAGQQSHFDARVAHLEQRAAANGIQALYTNPKPGGMVKLYGFGESPKDGVDLFALYLPAGSLAFRYLSGYVHSKPWVTMPRKNAEPSDEPGVSTVFASLDVVLFSSIVETVLDLHDETVGRWIALAGYPSMVWTEAKKGSGV
jgi:hypothetical protein